VVLPGAAPGDLFACEAAGNSVVVTRIFRPKPPKKKTKAQVIKAIQNWKNVPNITWEELRKITRESG
jgi:hypothetical protein